MYELLKLNDDDDDNDDDVVVVVCNIKCSIFW